MKPIGIFHREGARWLTLNVAGAGIGLTGYFLIALFTDGGWWWLTMSPLMGLYALCQLRLMTGAGLRPSSVTTGQDTSRHPD